jgi:hypothetical protein
MPPCDVNVVCLLGANSTLAAAAEGGTGRDLFVGVALRRKVR